MLGAVEMNERKTLLTEEEMDRLLVERHGEDIHRKLKEAHVAVAGLGGLGSNVAVMLARAGVGSLHLVDFDRVEGSNLNRQVYKMKHLGMYKTGALCQEIREINPYIELKADTICVTEQNAAGIFSGDRLICEAFDRAENKSMLVNADGTATGSSAGLRLRDGRICQQQSDPDKKADETPVCLRRRSEWDR